MRDISSDEFILRRVHKIHLDANQPLPVLPAAFRPSEADAAGLSVYRAKFVSPLEVASAGRSPANYYVVRLAVQSLHNLGLTVVPEEHPAGPPGHALIPELSVTSYRQNKEQMKAVLVELARLASLAIVHSPGP